MQPLNPAGLALFCIALGSCAGRMAEDGVERVAAGKPTFLQQTYMTMDRRCRPVARPTGTLTQPPRHGTVRLVTQDAKAVYGPGPYRHCDGRVGPSLAFEYTARPDYRGADAFAVRVRYRDGEIRDAALKVEVY